MKKLRILLIPAIFFIFQISLPQALAQGNKPYVSQSGGFSVWIPTKPVTTQSTEKTPLGAAGKNIYTSEKKGTYTVEVSVLPPIEASLESPESIYETAVKGFLERTGATQVSLTDVTVGGHPAKQLEYKMSDGTPGTARFVLAGTRFYLLSATTPYASWTRKFLASFKIL